ncbi:MAG: tetratricopeptide repeat protein [Bacteroidetes bacterium]|nr:tetratricopeptide repeat protein [Bacteroidota bacterium]
MKKVLRNFIILGMMFGFLAFQCQSTEITSAKLYIQQKNLDRAKESLEKEVQKNPKSDEGLYLLGYINGEEGNFDAMVKNFERSLKISSKFQKNIVDSRNYHWQNNFNKGVGYFNRGTKSTSEDSSKMHFDRSVAAFNGAIICQPDSADSYKNLTYSLINAGRNDECETPLIKVISLTKSADAYAMLGEFYYNKGVKSMNAYHDSNDGADSVKAMELFDKTLKILEDGKKVHPSDNNILLILSNAYVAADKLDIAMEAYKQGVSQDPTNQFYRYNYGVLLLGALKFEEASVQFNKAVEIDSEYANAQYNLGVTYVKWASTMREAAAETNVDDNSYIEKFKLSLVPLKKYIELKSDDSKVWELLGRVYANLGMQAESKEAFDKADMYK